ncbi:MAG: HAMP domain-containing histidine kinase [Candidatus Krumholzibacteriota bacterium]|nr:HAMP domain-containing histidine kinase [Candidatus Krumholzibacteriota bacterium]
MGSRKNNFIILGSLVAAALAGLIIVQVTWLNHAYNRELGVFSRNVGGALSAVIRKIESNEAWVIVSNLVVDDSGRSSERTMSFKIKKGDIFEQGGVTRDVEGGGYRFHNVLVSPDSTRGERGGKKIILDNDSYSYNMENNFITIMLVDTAAAVADTTIFSQMIEDTLLSASTSASDTIPFLERRYIIEKVVEEMDGKNSAAVTDRIEPSWLDSVIACTLKEAGIETPYAYGITMTGGDSIIIAIPDEYRDGLSRSEFRTPLFPHDLVKRGEQLVLYFPEKSGYLLGRERVFLVVALLSIVMLAGCFIYIIRAMWRQKRFSRQIVDFINNMTHEFKTPISTVAIAGENLGSMDEGIEPERIRNYARIISQESRRMRHQVEKILEMAALEEGDLNLSPVRVDIHTLLEGVVDGISVRINKAGGRINTVFSAFDPGIEADPTHLSSVFHNLLDNALKYTDGDPVIDISTEGDEKVVVVSIRDNGIGMQKGELRNIFNRYYRVSTGDLHDVKGFGLGLSYVRLIVEAHGGTVAVTSSPGRGSTFRLTLPRVLRKEDQR